MLAQAGVANGLTRDPDERSAETSYHAEKTVTIEQVADTIELTMICSLRVRRTHLPSTVFMRDLFISELGISRT